MKLGHMTYLLCIGDTQNQRLTGRGEDQIEFTGTSIDTSLIYYMHPHHNMAITGSAELAVEDAVKVLIKRFPDAHTVIQNNWPWSRQVDENQGSTVTDATYDTMARDIMNLRQVHPVLIVILPKQMVKTCMRLICCSDTFNTNGVYTTDLKNGEAVMIDYKMKQAKHLKIGPS